MITKEKEENKQQLKTNISYRDNDADKDLYRKVIRISQLSNSTTTDTSKRLIREGMKNKVLVESLIGCPVDVLRKCNECIKENIYRTRPETKGIV